MIVQWSSNDGGRRVRQGSFFPVCSPTIIPQGVVVVVGGGGGFGGVAT